MYPVNQVFLGNSDPLLSQSDITSQMQILKQYEAQLAQLQKKGTLQTDLIWDDIDNEMAIFKKFREFSKDNPGLTYEEFIKQWRST